MIVINEITTRAAGDADGADANTALSFAESECAQTGLNRGCHPLLISSVAARLLSSIPCSILPSGCAKDDHGYASLEYACVCVVDASELKAIIGELRGANLTRA